MLFNSVDFIGFFLPIVFAGFFTLARVSHRAAAMWLALASLFFYGWWDIRYVALLVGSITFNYGMGHRLAHSASPSSKKLILGVSVTCNLLLLGIFKYCDFLISTINALGGLTIPRTHIVLPLGISFFTFTQIAFLVDVYRQIAKEYRADHYLLFVTYFPHLIAGPVLHHKQMMPQFAMPDTYSLKTSNVSLGLTIFLIGLAKKIVLADNLAVFARPVFHAADAGAAVTFFESWGGVLAYTFQLYFDFSGYSDMAIGLSRLFGIELPLNFNSPYKSPTITEFWRRWHITLSHFLRDYIYVPLGGNRQGKVRRYRNILITMLLGGLWHGASWTFVVWGGLHGMYLLIHQSWAAFKQRWSGSVTVPERSVGRVLGVLVTFGCTVGAWVFFRAETFPGALAILKAMLGMNGAILPDQLAVVLHIKGLVSTTGNMALLGGGTVMGVFEQAGLLFISILICWALPNTQNMSPRLQFWAIVGSFAFVFQAVFFGRAPSEFLYFQF